MGVLVRGNKYVNYMLFIMHYYLLINMQLFNKFYSICNSIK